MGNKQKEIPTLKGRYHQKYASKPGPSPDVEFFALAKIPDFELDWTYSGSQFNEVRLDELRTPLVSGCLSFNPCPPY